MNYKKMLKLASIVTVAVIGTVSLSSCSIPGFKSPSPTAATTAASQATKSPEQAIVGSWKIVSITDKDGKSTSAEDIDLTGTPLESFSGMVGTVLNNGVTFNFKEDKTVSLSLLNGNYSIKGDTLTLSIPQAPQAIDLDFKIDDNKLTVKIDTYSLNLEKQ